MEYVKIISAIEELLLSFYFCMGTPGEHKAVIRKRNLQVSKDDIGSVYRGCALAILGKGRALFLPPTQVPANI